MCFQNHALTIDVGARQWNERVPHVKRSPMWPAEHEEHPLMLGHFFAKHHPSHNLWQGYSQFGHYLLRAEPEFDRLQFGLRVGGCEWRMAGEGRRRGIRP